MTYFDPSLRDAGWGLLIVGGAAGLSGALGTRLLDLVVAGLQRRMGSCVQTGDRPGSARVDSTLAAMASEIDRVEVSKPNPMTDQRVAPCPLTLVNNPG